MMFDNLYTLDILSHGMDAATQRQQAIANNLANVDTPGYRRSGVIFEEELQKALQNDRNPGMKNFRQGPRHIDFRGLPKASHTFGHRYTEHNTFLRNDKNNVDPDQEAVNLTKNSSYFHAVSTFARLDIQNIQAVIRQGAA